MSWSHFIFCTAARLPNVPPDPEVLGDAVPDHGEIAKNLTEAQRMEIVALAQQGTMSHTSIGKKFRVTSEMTAR